MITLLRPHLHNTLLLNTYLLFLVRILGTGFSFLFWALAARTMPATEVGLASGVASATMLLAGLAQLGLGYGLVRHLAHADDPHGLLNLSVVMSGLAGLGLAALFLIGIPWWSPALLPVRTALWPILLFIALTLSTTWSQLLNWAFLATRHLTFSLVKNVSQVLLTIIFLFCLSPLLSGYSLAITALTLATLLSLAWSFGSLLPGAQPGYKFRLPYQASKLLLSFMSFRSRRLRNPPISWVKVRSGGFLPSVEMTCLSSYASKRFSFTRYSLLNYLTDQFQRAPDTLLPLIVIHQFGPGPGGYFFVVWAIGRGIATWAGSIADALFAEGANEPTLAPVYARRSMKLGLLLTGGLSLAMVLGGKFLLLIYGPDYAETGIELLYYLALAAMPSVLLSIFVNFLRLQDRLSLIFVVMLVNISCGILFSYLGMLWFGFVGVGIGWLVSQIAVLGGAMSWWWKQSYQPWGMKNDS